MGLSKFKIIIISIIIFSYYKFCLYAESKIVHESRVQILPIEKFIQLAAKNNTVFDEILIYNLKLNYQKDLKLPARDILLSIKGQYDFYLSNNKNEPEAVFSLSKLFPFTGTEVTMSYSRVPDFKTEEPASGLEFLLSQPIAENAFGKTTRLYDKIIGIENDIARYQIIEAYEDYMAGLMTAYYNWYSAYENLKIGELAYKENLKLKRNMLARRKQKIALPIDVNKVELLILGKEEDIVDLREKYNNLTNVIHNAVRVDSTVKLIPQDPSKHLTYEIDFNNDYNKFKAESRTYSILNLLIKNSKLDIEKYASELLPSLNLVAGYMMDGMDWQIRDADKVFFAGVSMEWPLPDEVGKAKHEISKIEHKKTALSNKNKHLELKVNLKNIYLAIEREKELVRISEKKIRLADEILNDEAENYSFGKVTLNDYIDAVNALDQYKFSRIAHLVQMNKLMIEWLRLTDALVDNKVLYDKNR